MGGDDEARSRAPGQQPEWRHDHRVGGDRDLIFAMALILAAVIIVGFLLYGLLAVA